MKAAPRTTLCVLLLPLAMLFSATQTSAQDRTQNRSMVISRSGVVAAESPLAAQAGATILAHGGNAIDAAIATNAVMGVVEPMMNGIGGDLFAIVYDARTGKLYGLNASGWAPAALSIEFLKAKGITAMPQNGIQSVTVPGAEQNEISYSTGLPASYSKSTFSKAISPRTSPMVNCRFGSSSSGRSRSTSLVRSSPANASEICVPMPTI